MIDRAGSMASFSDNPKYCQARFPIFEIACRFRMSENGGMQLHDWIAGTLSARKKSKGGLAAALGIPRSGVSVLLKGERKLQLDELPKLINYLGERPPRSLVAGPTVPLRGYVGAGAAMIAFADADDPAEDVDAPEGATEDTVAVEVRGESLGALFDRWLVFYDEVRDPPTASMLGRLCVVGLADGRILVKQLKRGQLEGHYNLLSNVEPPIYDQIVEWAAIVKQMTPR